MEIIHWITLHRYNMSKNKIDRQFWETAGNNTRTYVDLYNRLVELAISMFDWQNLPDTIDARFLELVLFAQGSALFFKDDDIGYLGLRYAQNGWFDVYHNPIGRRAYADNGYNADRDRTNSVIIWNNMLKTNSMTMVQLYARRLYELERTIDVNVKAQKTPVLITGEDKEMLTLKNLYKDYDGNTPVIFADKSLRPDSLKVLKTDAPYIGDRLYVLKTQLFNECLTYLGISNVNIQKRERLLNDEVNRNMGGTIASRYSRLEMRQRACEEINKMFGLDVWVEYKEDSRMYDAGQFEMDVEYGQQKEGASNE